jgi:hypothetical protein
MTTGGTITTLTLPTGVTLDPDKLARMVTFGRYVVVVNSPTRPLTVDADGVVRVLTPHAPQTPITLDNLNGGSLTGTYLVKQSYVVFDANRQIIAESPLGPPSNSTAITTDYLRATNIPLSPDTVNASRLYRTTTGGTTSYFPWLDLDGNVQTSVADDLSDTGLGLVAAPTLGAPPILTLVGEFRQRLWGVSTTNVDDIRYTEASRMYAWPEENALPIPRIGSDTRGITGILARRDALAIARVNTLAQITGNSGDTFEVVRLSNEVGVEGSDSIAQYRDTIFFLWKDGVYTWNSGGIDCISDDKVRSWFTSDDYFNREEFPRAVGRIDPINKKYQLLLCNAGSTALDRWVEYDLRDKTWWGPHKTDAFTPTFHTTLYDADGLVIPVMGSSSGFLWREQDTRTDNTNTAIDFDVDSKFHDMQTPDIEKHFGQPALLSTIQSAGTLTITPYVGGLDASAGTAITADMTRGRERLPRLGDGRLFKLNFRNTEVGQKIEIFGYEIPFFERGRR